MRRRRLAESALQASERKFRNLVETTSDWIWETNEEGVFTYASPRTMGMLGYEPKELLGKKPSDLFTGDTARRLGETFDPASANHEPFALFEATVLHKHGQEVVLEISGVPVFEADVYSGYRGIARDITERKRATQKILETEARFFTIFNSVSDGVFVSDASTGIFIDANEAACKMFGHSRDELIGADFGALSSGVPPYTHAAAFPWYERARAGLVQPFEWHCKAKDGHLFWAEISLRCVPFGDRLVGLASLRDITARKRAEAALGESRRLIEEILNTITVRVFWKDRDLLYLGCNAVFARDAGFADPKDVVGKDDHQMGWRDQAELYRSDDRLVIESGRAKLLIEEPQTTPDGNTITLLTSKVPLRGSQGEIIGLLGTYMDITEYKQAQAARRASEERYRGLFEATRDGIFTLEPPSWKFTSANPAAVKMFGAKNEAELIVLTPWELSPERQPDGRASDEKARQMMEAARREGSHLFEWTHRRADGSAFPADVLLTRTIQEGRERIYATVREISERKRAEEGLRIAGIIIDNSPTVLYRTVMNGGEKLAYVSANVANFGYRPEDLIGKDITALAHPDDVGQAQGTTAELARSGANQGVAEYRVRAGDGAYLWVEDRTRLIRGPDGAVLGSEGVLVDITARKAAEETRAQLATVVASSRSAIIGGDRDANCTAWNIGAEGLYGYSAQEMIGRPMAILVPAERQGELRNQIATIVSGGDIVDFETVRVRKGGQLIDVSETISPIKDSSGVVVGASAVVMDIGERKRAERALEQTMRSLKTLSRGNEALVRATSQEGLFQEMCRIIVEAGGFRMAWIGLAENDAERTVRPIAHAGHETGYLALAKISWADHERGRGPAGTAIRSGKVQVCQDIANDVKMAPWQAEAAKRGYASVIALPLLQAQGVLGALSLFASEPNAFGPEMVALLAELAGDLSYGVTALRTRAERELALQRLERAMEETVQVVATTVEMRDAYTAGHQRRVAMISEAIAKEMGLSTDRVHGLRLASTLHDVGKINIPADILSKPGRLSRVEYELIKTHPQTGYDILKSVEFPWPVADMVLQHHERLDGSGYPNGLKDDAILLEARIMAVADVLEAMISHRPYRPAVGVDLAVAEIRKGSGKLYDPAVVEACLKVIASGHMDLGKA